MKVLRSANLDLEHYLSKIKVRLLPKNPRKALLRKMNRFDAEKLRSNQEFCWEAWLLGYRESGGSGQNTHRDTPTNKPREHTWWTSEYDAIDKTKTAHLKELKFREKRRKQKQLDDVCEKIHCKNYPRGETCFRQKSSWHRSNKTSKKNLGTSTEPPNATSANTSPPPQSKL